MLEFTIDSKSKKIHAVFELIGEEKPISLNLDYEIKIIQSGGAKIRATKIIVSKEWINLIAQEFVGREFSLQDTNSSRILKLIKDIGVI